MKRTVSPAGSFLPRLFNQSRMSSISALLLIRSLKPYVKGLKPGEYNLVKTTKGRKGIVVTNIEIPIWVILISLFLFAYLFQLEINRTAPIMAKKPITTNGKIVITIINGDVIQIASTQTTRKSKGTSKRPLK